MDRLTGEIKGFPFQEAEAKPVSDGTGATIATEFNKVESFEQLTESLSVDARVESRFGLFDAESSLSFDKSLSLNSYSIFVYAVARVERAFEQVSNPTYKPEAIQLLKQPGGPAAFREAYGDWFIRGIATGGQLLSIIEIRTKDEQQRKKIDADLKGSYGYAVKGNLDMESKFEQIRQSSFMRVVLRQVGGTPVNIQNPPEVFPKMQEWVAELENEASNKAVPYQVGWVSYKTVPVPGVQWVDLSMAEQNLDVLAEARKGYLGILADVQYVLANHDEFVWDGWVAEDEWVVKLDEWRDQLLDNLAKTQTRASAIAKDLTTTLEGLQLVTPDIRLPRRQPGEKTVEAEPATTETPTQPVGPIKVPLKLKAGAYSPEFVKVFEGVTGAPQDQ